MGRTVLALPSFAVALSTACFSDPPPAANDDTTLATTTGDASTSAQSDSATVTPTTTSPIDTSGTSPSTEESGTTGVSGTCGDGRPNVGDVCFDDEVDHPLSFDGPIHGIALGSFGSTSADGAIVTSVKGLTVMKWWTWNGGAPGPQVGKGQVALTMSLVPVSISIGDLDGLPGGEVVFSSVNELGTGGPGLGATTCSAAAMNDFTLAQIDDDPGLELVMTAAEAPLGLTAWLGAPGDCADVVLDPLRLKTVLIGALERADGPDGLVFSGDTDLVVGETMAGSFEFVTSFTHPLGEFARHMVVGDFNGDGLHDDLAIATDVGIVVLHGSDSSFAQGEFLDAGGIVEDLAVADLDLDGVDDLVIADSSSPVITLLLSDGNTGLAYVAGPDTGASNTAVAAADLNDDAVPDLVVGDENGDVRFYFANP